MMGRKPAIGDRLNRQNLRLDSAQRQNLSDAHADEQAIWVVIATIETSGSLLCFLVLHLSLWELASLYISITTLVMVLKRL